MYRNYFKNSELMLLFKHTSTCISSFKRLARVSVLTDPKGHPHSWSATCMIYKPYEFILYAGLSCCA